VFSKVPESKAETGDGASECASGNHAWNGAMPTFVPNPTKINANDNFSQKGFISDACLYRSLKNKESIDLLPIERSIIPTKARAIPIEQINTYFQAASRDDFFFSK